MQTRSSGIGGQAVLEGIMMRNGSRYSVAVREPGGRIVLDVQDYPGIAAKHRWMQVPFVRGVFGFADSLILGIRTMNYSSTFYEEEEENAGEDGENPKENAEGHGKADPAEVKPAEEKKAEPAEEKPADEKNAEPAAEMNPKPSEKDDRLSAKEKLQIGLTTVVAFILAVLLFALLPMYIAHACENAGASKMLTSVIEGVLRVAIFLGYVWAISLMKDIRRTYMYHGAEHKCINCIEHGLPLTTENVRASSRLHRRCGTSFLLIVMILSIFIFLFLQFDNMAVRTLSRILLIPVIAGISYEILRKAGNSDGPVIRAVSAPGLWLQHLTTREPDDEMIEVGIRAVEAVFDWKKWQRENA